MSIESPDLSAVVLAGGHSVRMGQDKASLPHPQTGSPLLLRQLDLLAELAPQQRLVSARTGQSLPPLPNAVSRVDDDGTAGPLGGIVASLAATPTSHLLVIAVDLPQLDLVTIRRLLADCDATHGAIATTSAGTEPLIAIYPRICLPVLERALSQQQLGLQRLLRDPTIAAYFQFTLFDPSPDAFHNWNKPI